LADLAFVAILGGFEVGVYRGMALHGCMAIFLSLEFLRLTLCNCFNKRDRSNEAPIFTRQKKAKVLVLHAQAQRIVTDSTSSCPAC
jgi:hypothetical protein